MDWKKEGTFFVDGQQTFIECKNDCTKSKDAFIKCAESNEKNSESFPSKNNTSILKIRKTSRTLKANLKWKLAINISSVLIFVCFVLLVLLSFIVKHQFDILRQQLERQSKEAEKSFERCIEQVNQIARSQNREQEEINENFENQIHQIYQEVLNNKNSDLFNEQLQHSSETMIVLEAQKVNETFPVKEMKNENREKSSHQDDSASRDSISSQQSRRMREKREINSLLTNDESKAVHLYNESPMRRIPRSSNGLINHWVPNRDSLSPPHRFRQNSQYEMIDNGSTIRIKQDGMYLIYAQLFFEADSLSFNQYQIGLRRGRENQNTRALATCSAVAPPGTGSYDLSCYTSVVQSLKDGDRIFIQVLGYDRKISPESQNSFFGLILLA